MYETTKTYEPWQVIINPSLNSCNGKQNSRLYKNIMEIAWLHYNPSYYLCRSFIQIHSQMGMQKHTNQPLHPCNSVVLSFWGVIELPFERSNPIKLWSFWVSMSKNIQKLMSHNISFLASKRLKCSAHLATSALCGTTRHNWRNAAAPSPDVSLAAASKLDRRAATFQHVIETKTARITGKPNDSPIWVKYNVYVYINIYICIINTYIQFIQLYLYIYTYYIQTDKYINVDKHIHIYCKLHCYKYRSLKSCLCGILILYLLGSHHVVASSRVLGTITRSLASFPHIVALCIDGSSILLDFTPIVLEPAESKLTLLSPNC